METRSCEIIFLAEMTFIICNMSFRCLFKTYTIEQILMPFNRIKTVNGMVQQRIGFTSEAEDQTGHEIFQNLHSE